MEKKQKRVIIVGAGLGGLSAAALLGSAGYTVDIHEKNSHAGGKLNELKQDGFTFDLGPSILTLPHCFERLFSASGRVMRDYIPLRPLRPHWRNFFEDGTVVDLAPGAAGRELIKRQFGERAARRVERFLDYSSGQYDIIARGYFEQGLDTFREFRSYYSWKEILFKLDFLRSMHRGVAGRIKDPYLRDIFDFFIKYVGSSARRAPAFMNLMPTIQYRWDLWYVDGGMYNIARGLVKLLEELGVTIHLNSEVAEITVENSTATGIRTADGLEIQADAVISNMEVLPAYRELLNLPEDFTAPLEKKFEPACSGLVLDIGVKKRYPRLAHHNFFFSGDQKEHFASVFEKHRIPDDPTLYVVCASRTDPSVAPDGCEAIKILPHIPWINPDNPPDPALYRKLRDRILAKMERIGLSGLRDNIISEHMWTPYDIEKNYRSNRGSIYGIVSDRRKNMAFKFPKKSSVADNLYFAGGSVNPGGGMPMVLLSGQHCARLVQEQLEQE